MRMVVGAVGGGSVTLEHILSQNISGDGSSELLDLPQLTSIVRSLSSKAGVSGGEILVGVARSHVELRNMQLPKASADEMPDMVRFTALRQFANVGDTWPIDFAPMPPSNRPVEGDAVETQEVVAMTINPATVSQIRKVCSEAGFNVTQLGLRPMASGTLAALVDNSPIGIGSTVLLIDMLADEADMVVLEKGHVSFMRTVRLPISEDGSRGSLPIGEIRRTLIAAVNARPGLNIDRVVLWSDAATAKTSLAEWEPNLDIPVSAIDPLSLIELKKSVEATHDTGRFAPLIGLLLQRKLSPHSAPANTFIDFLHPRQRPEKKKPIRQYALAAIAATLLIGGFAWWFRSTHQALDSEIVELTQKLKSMEPTLKLAQKNSGDWGKVEHFLAGDIQWLDELSYLSEKALPAEQMEIGDLTVSIKEATNAGEIRIPVKITDQKLQPRLEEQYRDKRHIVATKGVNKNPNTKSEYGWTFEPSIMVAPAVVVDPTTLPPPKAKPKKEEAQKAGEASKEDASRVEAAPKTEEANKTEDKPIVEEATKEADAPVTATEEGVRT